MNDWLKKVGEAANKIFGEHKETLGILLSGGGPVKEMLYKEDYMHADVKKNPEEKGTVDLNNEIFTWKEIPYRFPINGFVKKCLLEGLDDIGYTLSFMKDIENYEKLHPVSKIKN